MTGDTAKFYGYRDLDTAIYFAAKERKRILLVFSGWACMDSPGKEWKTLSLYDDISKINESCIIVWLAVDDKKLTKDTSQIANWNGKPWKLKTIGDQNSFFEYETFNYSSVPLFCFIDTLRKPFGKTITYTNNRVEVKDFIESGLAN